jgi:hypothetical protein
MNVDDALSKIGAVESCLADLYRWFADALASDGEAAAVFQTMSQEETKHAALVEFSRQLARSEGVLSPEVEIDLAGTATVLAEAGKIRGGPPPRAADAAIRQTLWLEMFTAEDHSRNRATLRKSHPNLARLLGALASEDKVHFARVMELARRRGIPVPGSAEEAR